MANTTLSPSMERVIAAASRYTRNDGKTGRRIYAHAPTARALVSRGLACDFARTNNGNASAVLTQKGLDTMREILSRNARTSAVA
jgi:hypothetical protein